MSAQVILYCFTVLVGRYYKSVITTLAVVESKIEDIKDEIDFIRICRKRSVFSDEELKDIWFKKTSNGRWYKPFIINFLYLYSFPKRLNLEALINLGVLADSSSAPRGVEEIELSKFNLILKESLTDERFIID